MEEELIPMRDCLHEQRMTCLYIVPMLGHCAWQRCDPLGRQLRSCESPARESSVGFEKWWRRDAGSDMQRSGFDLISSPEDPRILQHSRSTDCSA